MYASGSRGAQKQDMCTERTFYPEEWNDSDRLWWVMSHDSDKGSAETIEGTEAEYKGEEGEVGVANIISSISSPVIQGRMKNEHLMYYKTQRLSKILQSIELPGWFH